MIKYAKVLNEQTGLVDVGIGTNTEFYKSIGMAELDVKQSDIDNNWYLAEKCPMKTDEEKEIANSLIVTNYQAKVCKITGIWQNYVSASGSNFRDQIALVSPSDIQITGTYNA